MAPLDLSQSRLTAGEKAAVAVASHAGTRKLSLQASSDELPVRLRTNRQFPRLARMQVVQS